MKKTEPTDQPLLLLSATEDVKVLTCWKTVLSKHDKEGQSSLIWEFSENEDRERDNSSTEVHSLVLRHWKTTFEGARGRLRKKKLTTPDWAKFCVGHVKNHQYCLEFEKKKKLAGKWIK